jgi:hypothetical protein
MLNHHQNFYLDDLRKILEKLQVREEKDKCIFRIETINKTYQLALNINEELFHLHKTHVNLDRVDLTGALSNGQKKM